MSDASPPSGIPQTAATTVEQTFVPDKPWFDNQTMDASARLNGPITLKGSVTFYNSTTGTFASQSTPLVISDLVRAMVNPDLPELAAKYAADVALGTALIMRFYPQRQADLDAAQIPLAAAQANLVSAQQALVTAQSAVQALYNERNQIADKTSPAYATAQQALLNAQHAATEAAIPIATAQQAVIAAEANVAIAQAAFDPANPKLVLPTT